MSQAGKSGTWAVLSPLIRKYMSPYLRQLGVAIGFMILASLATAAFAQLLQPVLDKAMIGVSENPSTVNQVIPIALLILLSFAVRGIATYVHTIKMNKISQSIIADIQRDVFSHFMTLDLKFFHTYPSGQLVSRVTNDVNVMRAAVSDSFIGIGSNLLTLIFLLGVMLWQDWKLTLITMIVFPLASGLVVYLGRRLRKVSRSIQGETAHLSGVLTQIFQGIRQVQAYGMEDFERQKAGNAVMSVRNLNIKAVRIGSLSTPINELLVGLVVFGMIVYGGYRIADGELTPGGLLSFIAAFSLSYEPMKKLAKLNNSLQLGVGAAERILEMQAFKPAIASKPSALNLSVTKPEIRFQNISFEYNSDDDIKALDHVSFDVPAGQVTALVGASGSGKSTILNLILRFYDPQSGVITIDGQDIRDVSVESLRKSMALVSQDITIFNDTVAANIAYGLKGAPRDRIRAAARAAAAENFILRMPEGFDTVVGENGVRLSGGQKQRIALARAILRNAPILLLDEATSALDNESERLVQQTFSELQKDRTTLVIAHRLSTVQHADQIIVLDKGKIVERGRHADLLDMNGYYARMYNAGLINAPA
jgi:subfamily B ATP-binding cassette protein MsbA